VTQLVLTITSTLFPFWAGGFSPPEPPDIAQKPACDGMGYNN